MSAPRFTTRHNDRSAFEFFAETAGVVDSGSTCDLSEGIFSLCRERLRDLIGGIQRELQNDPAEPWHQDRQHAMSIDWRGGNPPAGVAKYAEAVALVEGEAIAKFSGELRHHAISGTSEDAHNLNEFKTIHLQSCYTSVLAINTQAGTISIFIDSAIEFSRTRHYYSSIRIAKFYILKGGLPNEHTDHPSLLSARLPDMAALALTFAACASAGFARADMMGSAPALAVGVINAVASEIARIAGWVS
nr:hypothetical protein [Methylobacterium sp. L1A1]